MKIAQLSSLPFVVLFFVTCTTESEVSLSNSCADSPFVMNQRLFKQEYQGKLEDLPGGFQTETYDGKVSVALRFEKGKDHYIFIETRNQYNESIDSANLFPMLYSIGDSGRYKWYADRYSSPAVHFAHSGKLTVRDSIVFRTFFGYNLVMHDGQTVCVQGSRDSVIYTGLEFFIQPSGGISEGYTILKDELR